MACTTGSDYTKSELTRRLCRAAPPSPRDLAATVKWAQLGDEAVVPPHECGSVAPHTSGRDAATLVAVAELIYRRHSELRAAAWGV